MPAIDLDSYHGVRLRRDGGVLYATLNNPAKKNVLTAAMQTDLLRLWDEVDTDDDVRVVVLTGEGDAFCAGADVSQMGRSGEEGGRQERRFSLKRHRDTFWKMLESETPIISKVRGPAYGIGVNICLCADIVIASENARFCDSHTRFGIAPGDGGAALWPVLIGFNRAKEYLMLDEPVPASRAAEMGLINHCLPDDELDAYVDTFAQKLAASAPMAITATKLSVNLMLKQLLAGAFETSTAYDMLTLQSEDVREGTRAFAEKRPPRFTGS